MSAYSVAQVACCQGHACDASLLCAEITPTHGAAMHQVMNGFDTQGQDEIGPSRYSSYHGETVPQVGNSRTILLWLRCQS